ncbi:MAG: hypothetical protein ABIO49_10805 [Dokdonella sp.]
MNASSKLRDDWRHVATVEIADKSDELEHVINDHPSCYRFRRHEGCPAGCSWFDILVDFGLADRQAAHAAYAVLTAAEHAACKGIFHGYRVVSAPYWAELAYILGHDGARMPLPLPDASLADGRAGRAAAVRAQDPSARDLARPTRVAGRG